MNMTTTMPIEHRLNALAAESENEAAEILYAAANAIIAMRKAGGDLVQWIDDQGAGASWVPNRRLTRAARDAFKGA